MGHYRKAFGTDTFGRVTKGPRERRQERRAGHVPRIRYDELGDGRMRCERCGIPVERFAELRCEPKR